MRSFAILFAVVPFAAAQEVKPDAKDAKDAKPAAKETVVPFELLPSRHFVVKVKLNGEGPFRFVFDTGAPITLIDTKTAKAAGLTKKAGGGGGILGMLGGGLNQIDVAKLEIEGALVEKTPAVVMDHPTVSAISKAFEKDSGPINGIVGFPFFARFATTVDYQKKELRLTPNGFKPGDYMADMVKNLSNIEERNKPKLVAPGTVCGFYVDKEESDEEAGIAVTQVSENGPAATGGLKVGDRLLTIDGRWTDSLADTLVAIGQLKPGTEVPFVVKRDGKDVTLKVKPKAGY